MLMVLLWFFLLELIFITSWFILFLFHIFTPATFNLGLPLQIQRYSEAQCLCTKNQRFQHIICCAQEILRQCLILGTFTH